ncbi:MAG: hypothetical protein HYR74_05670 [Candidatus Eisenbacteria bacterium]|nr:hypothetical protein [Candidatus Eisenbacteria bacterium]
MLVLLAGLAPRTHAAPARPARTAALSDSAAAAQAHPDPSYPAPMNAQATVPDGRYIHTSIYHPGQNRMLMFGGGVQFNPVNELWQLTLGASNDWTLVTPPGTPGPVRMGHTAIYDALRDRMIVFGGGDPSRRNDTWAFSASSSPQWTLLGTFGTPPPPISLHAAIYDPLRDRMIVFGGYQDAGYLNGVWALSLSTLAWTQITPSGTPPSPRREHSAIYDPVRDRMIVFGGTDGGYYNEVWALNFAPTPAWQRLTPSGTAPSARSGHSAVYDAKRDEMWVFAGRSAPGTILNDLWTLSFGGGGNPAWAQVSPAGGPPGVRTYHTAIIDGSDRMVVFSGYNGGLPNDTWFLALLGPPTWYALGSAPPPPPPTVPAPVFTSNSTLPSSISLGQTITLSVAVRNDGAASDDGRISVGFPQLTGGGDAQWVAVQPGNDSPGPVTYAAGATIGNASCQPMTAGYLVAEYQDNDWSALAAETNTFTLTVQPTATGTFAIDVRSTMHPTGGAPCAYVNGVPTGGQSGVIDQQGWPVTRFTVTVQPPPTAPQPSFPTDVQGLPTTISLGQSITLTASVLNDGAASDDGRISVSFPELTGTGDAQWVSSSSGGDTPGFAKTPAGGAMNDASCQPMTASYLAAEYVDNDWKWLDTERNDFTVTVRPQQVGTFEIYVRSTMHVTGGAPCAYVNGVPATGSVAVDQQGFAVRRFVVTVNGPPPTDPVPVFVSLNGIPASIYVTQSFTMVATVRNDGVTSDDARIDVSFPSLTHFTDTQYASGLPGDDSPGVRRVAPGNNVPTSACQFASAAYLLEEYEDTSWLQGEINTLTLTVRPPAVGTFYFYVRTTMHKPGSSSCTVASALPSDGDAGYVDQQGWAVKRYAVQVNPQPPSPAPVFVGNVTVPSSVTLGQSFMLSCTARNDGGQSDDGRIAVSFPTLTASTDYNWVVLGTSDDIPGMVRLPVGSALTDVNCQPVTGVCVAAEDRDNGWLGVGTESNTMTLTITPQVAGVFPIYARAAMHTSGGQPCDIVGAVPTDGEAGFVDQQGWPVRRYLVTVNTPASPPKPTPVVTSIGSLPASITLGENLMVTATVRNSGTTTDDGRVSFSFPSLTSPADGRWVTDASPLEGGTFAVFSAGSAMINAQCQAIATGYLTSEYRDMSWLGLNNETHVVKVTVQPQAVGSFDVYVRSTMHTTNGASCDLVDGWASSGTLTTDQQGWTVKKYTVQVLAPATPVAPAAVAWQPLAPAGDPPPARYGHAAVYDPVRDQMVLVAGNWGDCDIYNWALQFSPTLQWSPLPTFVGPGARTDERWHHSLIYDALDQQVVTYGGFCLQLKPDVMALDLTNPTSWARALGSGTPPTAREGHAAVYDPVRNRMLVIGGYDGTSRNDLWQLSLPDMVWTPLAPGGAAFPGRSDHSAAYDPVRDRVIVFGGQAGNWLNDVWALSLSPTVQWTQLTPSGTSPGPRQQQTMIYDPGADRLLMFGGADLSRHSDLWELRLAGAPAWNRLWSTNVGPSNRLLHTAVYDAARHRMVVYGGEVASGSYADDVWALALDAPTATTVDLVSADATAERVRLVWSVFGAPQPGATVYRQSAGSAEWRVLGTPAVSHDQLTYEDRAIAPGARYGYRLGVDEGGTETYSATTWVTVPAAGAAELALGPAAAGADGRDITVTFTLPDDHAARLDLFDLGGRRLAGRDVGSLGAGEHRVALSDGRRLAAGVYLVRLTHENRILRGKVAVLK